MKKIKRAPQRLYAKRLLIFKQAFRKISVIDPDKFSNDWLAWFIGFSEGDGAILAGKDGRLRFVLTHKETAILNHIHETLGIGRVRTYGPFSRWW